MPSLSSKNNILPSSRWLTIGATVLLLLGVAFAFGRAWKDLSEPTTDIDFSNTGMSDFHAMYYHAKAFRLGTSPYQSHVDDDIIFSGPSPPFSPVIFFIIWPLTYLPLAAADVVACLLNLSMIGGIAWLVFRYSNQPVQWSWWLAVFGFLVFSRPGHITLHTGYFTALLVIGTLMAFHHAKDRPWLSAVGVLLASAKPTYVIPLLLILAFRRNYKAAVYGIVLSGAVALAGVTWLATAHDDSSFSHVIETVLHGQEAFHNEPTEDPRQHLDPHRHPWHDRKTCPLESGQPRLSVVHAGAVDSDRTGHPQSVFA